MVDDFVDDVTHAHAGNEHERNVLRMREQMTSSQKVTLNENIELIKLKRSLKEQELNCANFQQR